MKLFGKNKSNETLIATATELNQALLYLIKKANITAEVPKPSDPLYEAYYKIKVILEKVEKKL